MGTFSAPWSPKRAPCTRVLPVVVCSPMKRKEGDRVVIIIGGVTVEGVHPSDEEIARNVRASQEAQRRAYPALVTPGIKLRKQRGIPYYRAHPRRPPCFLSSQRDQGWPDA